MLQKKNLEAILNGADENAAEELDEALEQYGADDDSGKKEKEKKKQKTEKKKQKGTETEAEATEEADKKKTSQAN